jgi:hypothetical protein
MIRNKIKKTSAILLALSATFIAPQVLAFGLGDLLGASKTSSSAGDPDTFIKSALAAEKLMDNSVNLLSRSLASKTESAAIEAQIKAANLVTDPAEKEVKLSEIKKSQAAVINANSSKEKLMADIAKMDGAQKENLGAAAFNFALALLMDKDLMGQASGLISSISSNPMNILKLASIKDVASSLANQVSAASQISSKMPDIFSAVGVKAPLSKDEKPKKVIDIAD